MSNNNKEKYIFTILIKSSSTIINYFASYFLAISLQVFLLGIWNYLISIINIGFIFLELGFDIIYLQKSNRDNIKIYFGNFFFIKVFLIVLNIFTTIVLAFLFNALATYFLIIIYLLLSKCCFGLISIFSLNLKSQIKVFKAEFPSFISNIGKTLFIIYFVLNLNNVLNPLTILSFSYFLLDLFSLIYIIISSRNEIFFGKPQFSVIKELIKDTKPLIYYSIIYILANNIGNIIINHLFGSEILGYYSFINSYIIALLLMISASIIHMSITIYSHHHNQNEINFIRTYTYSIEKYFSIFYLSIIIIVLLNSNLIFKIFLPKYIKSIPILNIMIFIPYMVSITRPYAFTLISGKNQKLTAKINSLINIIILILMLILIPNSLYSILLVGWGVIGCAIAQTLPWILWIILNRYYAYKLYDIKPKSILINHLALSFIAFLISYIIKEFILSILIIDAFLLLLISSILSILIFLSLLFIFKQLKKQDLKFLFNILSIKRKKEI